MNTLPVTDSTVSAQYLQTILGKLYGLSGTTHCRVLRTGINHSYIVTDAEKKFIFRIYSFNWRTVVEIEEELRLLNHLSQSQVPVSCPIPDASHQYIQQLNAPEGMRYGVLFLYAPGAKVRHFSNQTSFALGALMARMHKANNGLALQRVTYNAHTLMELPYRHATQHFSESNDDMRFIKQTAALVADTFCKAEDTSLRTGAVHLDMWYDNMHIGEPTGITLFDFDFCGNGWLLLDVAYFVMQLFHIEQDKQQYEARVTAFFAGYESVTILTAEEKRLLPYAGFSIWIFYLGVQSQRFDNWSNVFLSENYLKRYIGMVKDWLKYNKIDIE